ncbi:hypothetical protein ACKFKF_34120 [Phormidesmis sp. 146-12]
MNTTSPDNPHSIHVLNPQIALPELAFFQVVKVKLTREVATITGMKYETSEQPPGQWLYQLDGLTQLNAVWWRSDQLRSPHRK